MKKVDEKYLESTWTISDYERRLIIDALQDHAERLFDKAYNAPERSTFEQDARDLEARGEEAADLAGRLLSGRGHDAEA